MRAGREPVEGRARRGGPLLAGAVGLAVLVTLPIVFGLLSGDEASEDPAGANGPTAPVFTGRPDAFQAGLAMHGRLVFTTSETPEDPDTQHRIWVLDLETGDLSEGPLVPFVEELFVVDGERGRIVLFTRGSRSRGVAYMLTDLSPRARPREIAWGEVLSLSTDGRALIVGRTRRVGSGGAGCESHIYTLHRVDLDSGRERLLSRGRVACGDLVSATLHRELVVASFVQDGRAEVRAIWPQNPTVMFPDLAHVSVSPRDTFLFVEPGRGSTDAWPRTPTGPVLVWPGSGSPRPILTDGPLDAHRVVAWSPDGAHVVVNGIVGGVRGMWLVYVPSGTAELVSPPDISFRPAFSGATFDDLGTVFAASPGRLVAVTDAGTFSIPLPRPASPPFPLGSIGWLP